MAEPIALTDEYIYRIAPDGKSVQAAEKLLKAKAFRNPKRSDDGMGLEAKCKGSELQPYAVRVDLSDPNKPKTGCNCMSMKHPCKHALGLMLLAGRSPELFGEPADAPKRRKPVVVHEAKVRKPAVIKQDRPKDTGEALLQAILAEPEDDTPRLIYADWLEENGGPEQQARSEFIRVQVALANLDEVDPQAKAHRKRAKELWAAHRQAWLRDLPEALQKRKEIFFRRGFFEELHMPLSVWKPHLAALFAHHPIHRLWLSGQVSRNLASSLVVIPQLARLRALSLNTAYYDEPLKTLEILFGTPFFSGITRMTARDCVFSSRELGVLVKSPLLSRLRSLDVYDNSIGDGGAVALAESPQATNLRQLVLAGNPIGDDGGKALASSPHFADLEYLDLRGTRIGPKVTASLRKRFGDRLVVD